MHKYVKLYRIPPIDFKPEWMNRWIDEWMDGRSHIFSVSFSTLYKYINGNMLTYIQRLVCSFCCHVANVLPSIRNVDYKTIKKVFFYFFVRAWFWRGLFYHRQLYISLYITHIFILIRAIFIIVKREVSVHQPFRQRAKEL